MPNIEHSTLSGGEVHEPKGADTALENEVYVADGLGSGAWRKPIVLGVEDYNHNGGTQDLSPTETQIENNGAGPFTNTVYALPNSSGGIWDTVNNQFNFPNGGVGLGDVVNVRISATVQTFTNQTTVTCGLRMAVGGFTYDLISAEKWFKSAGIHNFTHEISVYMGDTNTLDNPAYVIMKSDDINTVVTVEGWAITIHPRSPVYE